MSIHPRVRTKKRTPNIYERKLPPRETVASLGGVGLESVGYSHVLGMAVVEFEHRHCLLICQRGVRATEAFELLFVETAQPIIERLVFGMRSRNEWHSTSGHYVEIITRHIGLLGVRIESDIGVADMDGVAFDIKLLLFRSNLHVSKRSRRNRRTVKMHPLIVGVND